MKVSFLTYAVLLFAAVPGCQGFRSCRPCPVEVRDAETNQPIAGADVRLSYPIQDAVFPPSNARESTAADGIARLRAVAYGSAGLMVEANAKGYMSEVLIVPVPEVQEIEPAHWFEDINKRPARLVLQLYAEPHPEVELVLPADFRGQVQANVMTKADALKAGKTMPSFTSGQRLFSYEVPASGVVDMIGPPLIGHVAPQTFRVRFADNYPISPQAQNTLVGYWWLKGSAQTHYFLIGTQNEFNSALHSLQIPAPSRQNHSSGGGQGRHGHKNRGAITDPGPQS